MALVLEVWSIYRLFYLFNLYIRTYVLFCETIEDYMAREYQNYSDDDFDQASEFAQIYKDVQLYQKYYNATLLKVQDT